jgi:ribonuclease R
MIDTTALLEFMGRKAYQPLPFRVLADRLGVTDPEERRELESLVNGLEADGVLRRKKQALSLAHPHALITGAVDVARRGFAFIRPTDAEGPDTFVNPSDLGGALDGDLVLAQRLPRRARERGNLESARVLQVLQRKHPRIVGTLRGWRKRYYVVPDGMSFAAEIALVGNDRGRAEEGDKVVVEMSARSEGKLAGRIVEVLGSSRDPAVDVPMIIAEFALRTEFPAEALAEAERLPDEVSAAEVKGRHDLRGETVVTVDPQTAQDFDDAISLSRRALGWSLGVHIADVSHYVRPGTALWEEAAERATSVYLPGRTLPMLPERISNGLCSLRPDEDRLTLSVFMELDAEGNLGEYRIARSVIRSAKRLTYEQALAAMTGEGSNLPPRVAGLLGDAGKLAAKRTEFRRRRGALEIDRPEVELEYEGNRVVGAHPAPRDDAHRMIEEFMLLANECVARWGEERGRPFIHRVHEPPDARALTDLFFFAQSLGISSEIRHQRQAIQAMLERVAGTPISHAVNLVVLKSMKHAEYRAESLGHYALAAEHYLHFTSPIRRFPDLVVHTALKEYDLEKGLRKRTDLPARLERYAKHSTDMEVAAERAEREVVKVKLLRFLEPRKGEILHGVVVGVQEYGAFVELEEVPVDGLISSRQMGGAAEHDKRRHTLTGPRKHMRLRVGDRIRVQIDRIDLERRELDLRWVR